MNEDKLGVYFVCLMVWVALGCILLGYVTAYASTTEDAVETALKAAYEQTGIKEDVENYGKKMQKRYVDKDQERYWAALVYIADSLYHYEIKVKVTF